MTNQTIDGVLVRRELLKRAASRLWADGNYNTSKELRALLEAPSTEVKDRCGVVMVDCPEGSHQWDYFFECRNKPAAQPEGEPVAWLMQAIGKDVEVYRNRVTIAEPTMRDIEIAWGQSVIDRFTIVIKPLYAERPAPVAVEYKLHMGDALKVFDALKVARIGRRVDREELGPMGATEIETWSSAIGVNLEMHTAMGGCTLIVRGCQGVTHELV